MFANTKGKRLRDYQIEANSQGAICGNNLYDLHVTITLFLCVNWPLANAIIKSSGWS